MPGWLGPQEETGCIPPTRYAGPSLPQGLGMPSSPSTPLPLESDTQSPLQAPLRHRQQGTKDVGCREETENMEAWAGESTGEGRWGGDTGPNMTDQGQQMRCREEGVQRAALKTPQALQGILAFLPPNPTALLGNRARYPS